MADASAAISALLRRGPARSAFGDQQVHVPHLIDSEVAHGLRRRVAAQQLAADAARSSLRVWQRLAMTRYPMLTLLHRVWELRESLSAYDAAYVALAEALDCTLMTADARLARAPGVRCVVTVVPS